MLEKQTRTIYTLKCATCTRSLVSLTSEQDVRYMARRKGWANRGELDYCDYCVRRKVPMVAG
jgi:hypothetical protein